MELHGVIRCFSDGNSYWYPDLGLSIIVMLNDFSNSASSTGARASEEMARRGSGANGALPRRDIADVNESAKEQTRRNAFVLSRRAWTDRVLHHSLTTPRYFSKLRSPPSEWQHWLRSGSTSASTLGFCRRRCSAVARPAETATGARRWTLMPKLKRRTSARRADRTAATPRTDGHRQRSRASHRSARNWVYPCTTPNTGARPPGGIPSTPDNGGTSTAARRGQLPPPPLGRAG